MIKSHIDNASLWGIKGWCFDKDNPIEKLEIFLYKNDEKVCKILNNNLREKLFETKRHPTGKCGFNIYPASLSKFKPGDTFSVRVNNEIIFSDKIKSELKPIDTKNNKILIVGLGKSGTSKLTYVINGAMLDDAKVYFEPGGGKGLENINQHRQICNENNVIHKSLFMFDKQINFNIISKLYNKKIWIVRDPRDRMISYMLYRWYKGHKPNKSSFDEALALVSKKEESSNSVNVYEIMHVFNEKDSFQKKYKRQYLTLSNVMSNLDKSWHVIKYEDMIDEKLDELNAYLGFNVNIESEVPSNLKRVVRSKAYGNWRDWFTEKDVAYFKPIFNPFLQSCNYDTNDWNIESKSKLNPEKGSLYMKALFTGK